MQAVAPLVGRILGLTLPGLRPREARWATLQTDATGSLLHDVGELVGQESLPAVRRRLVLVLGEHDLLAHRERLRPCRLGLGCGRTVGAHPYPAEVVPEVPLQRHPDGLVEGLRG